MIKPWHRNAVVSGLKARLPLKRELRDAMRRLRPYRPDPDNDAYFLENALTLAAAALAHQPAGGRYLEFGAGWTPAMAAVFHAIGYDDIVLCDLERFLDDEGAARARRLAESRIDALRELSGKSADELRTRISNFRYTYLFPFDLSALPAGYADIVISRAVLEHVPLTQLPGLLAGVAHVLKPGRVTVHLIDNSDHYEHADKSISRVNFLRYSPSAWRLIQTVSKGSQNRMRHSDYREAFGRTALDVLVDDGAPDSAALESLQSLTVAPEFAAKTPEDLAVLTSLFILRKPMRVC